MKQTIILNQNRDFQTLYKRGISFVTPFVVIYMRPNRFGVHRLGITSIRRMRVYVRGNNLCTVSKIKDVDPEAIGSGLTNYPLMRTFVAGVKLTF